ncbi:MAG TPA: pilus assembly protein TadG-related protein [Verrucomicrobiae bacterium]|nr:pilus assembly protein TadG-related protein [Verrucomicrobiae bacterium]
MLVTLFIFVLFGFTALSIDVANVYSQKHKAHDATDAAALAGVAKLAPSGSASDAITEAEVIANTNGVTHAEITASNTGTIEVGSWDGTNFTANTAPFNAVHVPAQRTVTNHFGRVVGFPLMTPVVDSIAEIGVHSVPYGIPSSALQPIGGTNTLQQWNPGNWGLVELCGPVPKNDPEPVITNGCFGSIGSTVPAVQGIPNKTANAFQDMYNSGQTVIVLPVTSDFQQGSSGGGDVTVQNFVIVQLLNAGSGSGSGWSINVQILGLGFDDLKRFGLGPVRSLVE